MTEHGASGLALARRFYVDAVRPIVHRAMPRLRYAAALIGPGSEVLGFDDAMSRDHHWGPRLQLLLAPIDHRQAGRRLSRALAGQLPPTFDGHSTHFGPPDQVGVRLSLPASPGRPIDHMVEIHDLRTWANDHLGFDPMRRISARHWLETSEQRLLEFVSGEVFHDADGRLTRLRHRLSYFPRHVWITKLADAWERFSQEEAFVGRAGQRGDDLGSRLIAARQIERLMALAFLIERRYRPYSKWLEASFNRLALAPRLSPHFNASMRAEGWKGRERRLARAAQIVAEAQNGLRLTPALPSGPRPFHARGFMVLGAERFAVALRAHAHGSVRAAARGRSPKGP